MAIWRKIIILPYVVSEQDIGLSGIILVIRM
jgi:hypothetical protein